MNIRVIFHKDSTSLSVLYIYFNSLMKFFSDMNLVKFLDISIIKPFFLCRHVKSFRIERWLPRFVVLKTGLYI